jgi:hypothetical protein
MSMSTKYKKNEKKMTISVIQHEVNKLPAFLSFRVSQNHIINDNLLKFRSVIGLDPMYSQLKY